MQQSLLDGRGASPGLSTSDAVHAHQADVLQENLNCGQDQCPRCGAARGTELLFRRHAFRDRSLRVIVNRLAYRIDVRLIRWRCPLCRKTFTDYPPFMLPYKQYALPDMRVRAARYVMDDSASYRKCVTESGLPIFHADASVAGSGSSEAEKESEDTPVLAHTTLYRWVTTLGKNAPQTTEDGSVAPRKSWTLDRGGVLLGLLSLTRASVYVEAF